MTRTATEPVASNTVDPDDNMKPPGLYDSLPRSESSITVPGHVLAVCVQNETVDKNFLSPAKKIDAMHKKLDLPEPLMMRFNSSNSDRALTNTMTTYDNAACNGLNGQPSQPFEDELIGAIENTNGLPSRGVNFKGVPDK